MRLSDGVVTQEINPQAGSVLCTDGIAGIAWDPTNSRLLASIDQTVFQLGFDGTVVGPLATEPAAAPFWLEGLAVLNDGRIAAADYYNARVRIWDATFNRLRSQDRGFRIQPAAHLRGGSRSFVQARDRAGPTRSDRASGSLLQCSSERTRTNDGR
ncbi:MAG TPA: hypothetical protein VNZ26_28750 [Vicinamibacterales bacterium]|nr:hypothetical protein [Vicinamibacterales bacterium]